MASIASMSRKMWVTPTALANGAGCHTKNTMAAVMAATVHEQIKWLKKSLKRNLESSTISNFLKKRGV